MTNFNFANSKDMKTLEEYGSILIISIACLKTLESYQLDGLKLGFLDEDESESAATICWEIKRLIMLFKSQVENISERTKIDEEEIIQIIKKMHPDLILPQENQ